MAAGTDITHPVSALDGAYKPLPLESLSLCTIKENGVAMDNHEFTSLEINRNDREVPSRPSRSMALERPPAPVRPISLIERPQSIVRRSASTSHFTPSDLVGKERSGPPVTERNGLPLMERNGSSLVGNAGNTTVEYLPFLRSGGWVDIGRRESMEDTHLRIDDLVGRSLLVARDGPSAFYGVFDGHGGTEAASFVRDHLLSKILMDVSFPTSMCKALKNAFLQTDRALGDEEWASGTTALTAMVLGRDLLVANAGDCRAVLCRRGKALDLSRDHKPGCVFEKSRIEAAGGYVYDGYLNGLFGVTRALGDWRVPGVKEIGVGGPLSAEPDVEHAVLTEEDEFMIIGCDGLWDVFTSQNAVDFARRKLQEHNDPELCSKDLVKEALQRETSDNLTVVTVCFTRDRPPKPKAWTPRFKRSISAEGLRNLQDHIDDHQCLHEKGNLLNGSPPLSLC